MVAIGLRWLLTAMSAFTAGVCVAALWTASAVLSIGALTAAREDQLVSSAHSTGQQVVGYFNTATIIGLTVAADYNSSHAKNPAAPEVQFSEDYFDFLYFAFRDVPVVHAVAIFAPRDRGLVANMTEADRVCDVDGFVFSKSFGSVVNAGTVGSYAGCAANATNLATACTPGGFTIMQTGGETTPANPGKLSLALAALPCATLPHSSNIWSEGGGLPGDIASWDTGLTSRPRWGDRVFTAGEELGEQTLLRKVHFSVRGPAWAPRSASGGLTLRMTQSTTAGSDSTPLLAVLRAAAARSKYHEILMVLSEHKELVSISDPAIDVETVDVDGNLALKSAANVSAFDPGCPVPQISSLVFEMYCPGRPVCEWSAIPPAAVHHLAGYVVALKQLEDPHSDNLRLLLVSAVEKSIILKPARELNVNIAIISCCIFAGLCAVSLVVANYLATPISRFSRRLIDVSVMSDLDYTVYKPSVVAEIDTMQTSLKILVRQLVEYKSYLPSSMFDEDTAPDAEPPSTEDKTVSKSDEKSAGSKPSSGTLKGQKVTTAAAAAAPHVVGTKCSLRPRQVTVLTTNVCGWSSNVCAAREAKVIAEQSVYVAALFASLHGKGKIDRFNGDRVIISFGSHTMCSSSEACKIGYEALSTLLALQSDFLRSGVVGSMSKGRLFVGNSGDTHIRAFNLVGPAVNVSWKFVDLATALCQKDSFELILDDSLYSDVHFELSAIVVGVLKMHVKFPWMTPDARQPRRAYLVTRVNGTSGWMYQPQYVEDSPTAQSIMGTLLSSCDETVYDTYRETLFDLLTDMGKPLVADRLAKSYPEFCTNAFLTL